MTIYEIEQMFWAYKEKKAYLELHTETTITASPSEAPGGTNSTESKVERKAIQNLQPRRLVKMVEVVLSAATITENNYFKSRYITENEFYLVAADLRMTEQGVYRVRKRLLNRAARIINQ